MVIIFLFSSRQRVHVSDVFSLNFLFFKTLHVIEYAALYFLLYRARHTYKKTIPLFSMPLFIAILYAISDEIHQTFVPTREGSPRDVLIDTGGMLFMYTLINRYRPFFRKYL
jgi:VanZ family protein